MTGSGTEADPYVITTVADLQDMQNDLAAYYELGQDIDASATTGWNAGAGFVPVGDWLTPFAGHFNGKRYTIRSLYINRPTTDYVGLFGRLTGSALNVNIEGCDITGQQYVGALAGMLSQPTNYAVQNVTVSGTITATGSYCGGIIGDVYEAITTDFLVNCSNSADVTGVNYVGGIAGNVRLGTTD